MDNRSKTRFRISPTVMCEDLNEKKPFHTVIRDMSHGGIKLTTEDFIETGHDIQFDINLVEKRVRGVGKVRWCDKLEHNGRYNVGIEFSEIDDGDKDSLEDFINKIVMFS